MSDTQSKIMWHVLFGMLLEELLPPVGISVQKELQLLSKPPKADIVLLKRKPGQWTDEQLARLPDGIRETHANDILLEFKYTESIDEDTFEQALRYHSLYKQMQSLTNEQVQTFIVSAKQTQARRLSEWGYVKTGLKGVYHHPDHFLLRNIPLLSLNELSDEPHNAWVKCFASRIVMKKRAFGILRKFFEETGFNPLRVKLEQVLAGLWQFWFVEKGDEMRSTLTEEQVQEMGKMWGKTFLSNLTPAERLAGLKPAERLVGLKPAERLVGLKPAERLIGLKPAERLVGLKPAEVLAGFKPAERLVGLKPAERLAGLKPEDFDEIEKLIKKRGKKR